MHLPTDYQQFIHTSRYARWLENEKRRETWPETVARYFNFFEKHLQKNNNYTLTPELRAELEQAVLKLEVMPSMRALMTAGPALERDNTAAYNCAYLPIDHPRAFDETLYVLMCGAGVGFSVEQQYVKQLPVVNEHFEESATVIIVEDSKAGWARAYRELVALLYMGQVPRWDMSGVRPAGARLKTFGGRASGPGPLEDLFRFTITTFKRSAGRKLNSIECHDLICKIAEVVVVGGVRRSALISLSDLEDDRMRNAKVGQWWEKEQQRALANNSVAYKERPDIGAFMEEWLSLYKSKSGERGVFNRLAAQNQAARNGRRDILQEFGVNPCSEIILRPYQFCNLTEVVIRAEDTQEDIGRKVRIAAILGTFQATLTSFKYLRRVWKQTTEEERLLGVSLTGVFDSLLTDNLNGSAESDLVAWKNLVVAVNKEFADAVGIPQATAATCVKPSGTVSQLVDSASGFHARHAPYYIRSVRGDNKDPITQFLKDAGVPNEPDVTKPGDTTVFFFPQKAPKNVLTRNDLTAIGHLELWLLYQRSWCEHKASVTVTVRESEWLEVGAWVWEHFDEISGVSFLPHTEHTYRQPPYQEVTEEQYEAMLMRMPVNIDWTKLSNYEQEDNTSSSQTLACTGSVCEIVDIGSN